MANHKSAEKAYRQSEKKNFLNKSRLNKIKTYIKKVCDVVAESQDPVVINKAFRDAQSEIAKGVKNGCLKLNAASRKIANLARKVSGNK